MNLPRIVSTTCLPLPATQACNGLFSQFQRQCPLDSCILALHAGQQIGAILHASFPAPLFQFLAQDRQPHRPQVGTAGFRAVGRLGQGYRIAAADGVTPTPGTTRRASETPVNPERRRISSWVITDAA